MANHPLFFSIKMSLSHLVFSPLIIQFFFCIYPTSPLGLPWPLSLLLLVAKKKQMNKNRKIKTKKTFLGLASFYSYHSNLQ